MLAKKNKIKEVEKKRERIGNFHLAGAPHL
jgi:hypothetical protein